MLTAKQKRFCEEYLIDCNGTQAAIRAGFSKKTARSIANEYLTKPDIKKYVSELQQKLREKTEITAVNVIAELAKVGFSNVQDFLESKNGIVDLSTLKRDVAASVSSIKVKTIEVGKGKNKAIEPQVEFKLHDKIAALRQLGQHLGVFEKDNSQKAIQIKVTRKQ